MIFALAAAPVMAVAVTARGYPFPKIPREQIPADAPPQVRDLIEKLYSKDDVEAMNAAKALGDLGEAAAPAAPFLAGMINTRAVRGPNEAAEAMRKIGRASVEPAILALQLGDIYGQARAADILGSLKDPRAIDPLVTALDEETRGKKVAQALAAIGRPALERVLAGAVDKDPEVRRRCVRALGVFAEPESTEMLNKALADPQADIRLAALEALVGSVDQRGKSHNGGPAAALSPSLLSLLNDPDVQVRREAARVIGSTHDPAALDALAAATRDPDPVVRRAAIEAVGGIKGDRVVTILLALAATKDPADRSQAAALLGQAGDARAADTLRALLKDPDPMVREKAVTAFAAIKLPDGADKSGPLVTAVKDDDALVRRAAVAALGGASSASPASPASSASPGVVEALSSALADADDAVRVEALTALARSGKAGDILLKALGNDRAAVRQKAVELLARDVAKNADVAAAVTTALKDADPSVRDAALRALADARVTPPLELVRPLLADADYHVRHSAIRILSRAADAESFPIIAARLTDQADGQVAAEALALYGAKAVPALADALKSTIPDRRRSAARALSDIDDPAARQALTSLLEDKDAAVREAAQRALGGRYGPPDAQTLAALVRSDPTRAKDADALAALGERAIPALSGLLKDDRPAVRAAAAGLLGRIADPSAAAALASVLKDDPDPHVRARAAAALAGPTEPAARAALAAAAAHDHAAPVRAAAVRSLTEGLEPPAEAAEILRAALKDDADWHVRWAAADGLGKLAAAPGSTQALSAALKDPHWYVRRAAAAALATAGAGAGDKSALPPLIAALDDPHWYVRQEAMRSLARLTGESLPADPKQWQAWWAQHEKAGGAGH